MLTTIIVDGDELNLLLLLDEKQNQAFYRLAPHLTVWDLQKPGKISGVTALPGPVIANISNFFNYG